MNKYEVKYKAPCMVTIIIKAKSEEEALKEAKEGTFNELYTEILEVPNDVISIKEV